MANSYKPQPNKNMFNISRHSTNSVKKKSLVQLQKVKSILMGFLRIVSDLTCPAAGPFYMAATWYG